MRDLFLVFVVECVAFVLAIMAGLSFIMDDAQTGVVLVAGAWALIWWGSRKLKEDS